jgi:hypothetical protein
MLCNTKIIFFILLKKSDLRFLKDILSAFCLFQSAKRLLRYSSNSLINLRRLSITSYL